MSVEVTQHNPFKGVRGMRRGDSKAYARVAKRLMENLDQLTGDDRVDAAPTMAFARELEYRYTETFDVEMSQFKARQLIPVDLRVPSSKEFFTYKQFLKVGDVAKISHSYADDAPMADAYGEEFSQRIVSIRSAYNYSVQDMRAAADDGVPLEAIKAENAREMIERKIEDLAAFGAPEILQPDGATQMYGLLNAPNVSLVVQTANVGTTWEAQYLADASTNKTTSIAQMVQDINALTRAVFDGTKGEAGGEGTLTMVVPTTVKSFLRNTPRSINFDSTGQSLWDYLIKTCGLAGADFWNRCDLANAGLNKGRIVVYEKNPKVVSLIISQDFEQFAPQLRNMGFVINCHARTGAATVRYPLHMKYMDGPSP